MRALLLVLAVGLPGTVDVGIPGTPDVAAPGAADGIGPLAQTRPRVVFLEGPEESAATVEISFGEGAVGEPVDLAGVTSLLMAVLAGELQAAAGDGRGVSVAAWAELDRSAVRVQAPPDSLPGVLDRVLAVLVGPELDPDQVALERSAALASLQGQLLSPDVQVARLLIQDVFRGHPYSVSEGPESLRSLDVGDVAAAHARVLSAPEILVVAGGLGEDGDLRSSVRSAGDRLAQGRAGLSGLSAPGVPSWTRSRWADSDPAGEGPAAPGHRIVLVNVPGAPDALFQVGHAVEATPPAEWAALTTGVELMALENARTFRRWESFEAALGPVPSLGLLTRQERGGIVRFTVRVPVEEGARALQTLLEGVELGRRTLFAQERLDIVRDRLLEDRARDRSTAERVAQVSAYWTVGLGTDPREAFEDWLAHLDVYGVRDALQEHVHPARLSVVAAGDASILLSELEFFGPVSVVDLAGNALWAAGEGAEGAGVVPGEEGTGPAGTPDVPVFSGTDLPSGRWTYRILVSGEPQGTMVREIHALEDGSAVVQTALEMGSLRQEAEVRFLPDSLRAVEARLLLRGGVEETETLLHLDGTTVSGTRREMGGAFDREILSSAPRGSLLGELLELALWTRDLAPNTRITALFVDPGTGQSGPSEIRITGEARLDVLDESDVPVWVAEVLTPGVRQRLFLRKNGVHLPVASEIPGQPFRLELVQEELRGRLVQPSPTTR